MFAKVPPSSNRTHKLTYEREAGQCSLQRGRRGGPYLSHKLLLGEGSVVVISLCEGQPRERGEAARVGG